jgi:hypothetical protein
MDSVPFPHLAEGELNQFIPERACCLVLHDRNSSSVPPSIETVRGKVQQEGKQADLYTLLTPTKFKLRLREMILINFIEVNSKAISTFMAHGTNKLFHWKPTTWPRESA